MTCRADRPEIEAFVFKDDLEVSRLVFPTAFAFLISRHSHDGVVERSAQHLHGCLLWIVAGRKRVT
jgi:hypothetical protein